MCWKVYMLLTRASPVRRSYSTKGTIMHDCSRNRQQIRSSLEALMLIIQGGIMAALQTEYSRITHARCPPEILLKNNYSLVIFRTSSSAWTFLN